MPEYTDPERLTKLETEMESMKTVLLRVEAKMDAWQQNFVSKEVLNDKLKLRDDRIERLEQEKTSYKNNLPFWFSVFISAAAFFYAIWPHK